MGTLSSPDIGTIDTPTPCGPTHRTKCCLSGSVKEAAMYLYPFEDHGPATKETLLDLWGRWAAWLDIHLKDPELVFE